MGQFSAGDNKPDCLLITGESGAGKSTVRKEFARQFPRREEDECTIIPVLHLEVPAMPTIKNVAERILIELGDPFAERGSAEGKTSRIITLMETCGVRLVILDEFQHFVDRASDKVDYKVADWLKYIINASKVPFVLMGLPRCERIVELNEQLRRRFLPRIALTRFAIDSLEGRRQLAGVLRSLERNLPGGMTSVFTDKLMIARIYYATHGLMDHLMKLASEAVRLALTEGKSRIDLEILQRAFGNVIWGKATDKGNPFHRDFVQRHLTKRGEPFYGYA